MPGRHCGHAPLEVAHFLSREVQHGNPFLCNRLTDNAFNLLAGDVPDGNRADDEPAYAGFAPGDYCSLARVPGDIVAFGSQGAEVLRIQRSGEEYAPVASFARIEVRDGEPSV